MPTPFRSLLVVLIAVVAPAGCSGDDEAPNQDGSIRSGEAPVRIVNFEFKPQKVAVKPGTRVTWKNEDAIIHDVQDTSPLATPKSPEMAKGDTFSITYPQPGSYSYICGIHQYMTGSVEVVP